jgi:hypothetical protein
MTCNCTTNTDIRGRCNPHYYPKEWKTCPVRADTTYEMMKNDYDIYKVIEKKGTLKGLKGYIKKVMKEYKITDEEWEQMLIWDKEEREEYETEEEKERRLKKEEQNAKKREYNRKKREQEIEAVRMYVDNKHDPEGSL